MTSKRDRRKRRPHLVRVLRGPELHVVKAKLRARDGDGCFYCLKAMVEDCTLEHLHRWADGGTNHPSNLVLAHRDCNWATKDLIVDQKMLLRGDALLAQLKAGQARAA